MLHKFIFLCYTLIKGGEIYDIKKEIIINDYS